MQFKVLSPYGDEGARWSSLIGRLKPEYRDIHFLPEYGLVYKKTYGHEPFLAFYGNEQSFIIQPFVKRLLNGLPFLKEQKVDHPYYDIANPYGYGGPVCRCDSVGEAEKLFRKFNEHFVQYCEQEKIASEFTSLHPFLGIRQFVLDSGLVNLVSQKEIVYIDLSAPEDEIWQGMNRGHRSSINKARKSGVRIEKVATTSDHFMTFKRLYYSTMERSRATERWFFPQDYFLNCFEFLGEKRLSLFFAYVEDVIVAAYLLIQDFATAYYHFGGSDHRYYDLRPNNLLMFETALWAKRQGYRRYHLGGGVSSRPDDSLLRFKAGFSDKRAMLYTYGRIHHKPTYESLCAWKTSHELATAGSTIQSDYFPLYRR